MAVESAVVWPRGGTGAIVSRCDPSHRATAAITPQAEQYAVSLMENRTLWWRRNAARGCKLITCSPPQITAAGQFCDCRTARVATRLICCSGSYNRQQTSEARKRSHEYGDTQTLRRKAKERSRPFADAFLKRPGCRDLALVLATADLLCSCPNARHER